MGSDVIWLVNKTVIDRKFSVSLLISNFKESFFQIFQL